jgi:hypothetical protein
LFQTSKETKRIKAVYACLSKNDKLSSICQRIKEKKVASAQQLEHLSFFWLENSILVLQVRRRIPLKVPKKTVVEN